VGRLARTQGQPVGQQRGHAEGLLPQQAGMKSTGVEEEHSVPRGKTTGGAGSTGRASVSGIWGGCGGGASNDWPAAAAWVGLLTQGGWGGVEGWSRGHCCGTAGGHSSILLASQAGRLAGGRAG
jgi:hypothetical protein